MDGGRKGGDREAAPPPDGPEGHNGLDDAAEEAVRALEKEGRDGEGTAGFGDVG